MPLAAACPLYCQLDTIIYQPAILYSGFLVSVYILHSCVHRMAAGAGQYQGKIIVCPLLLCIHECGAVPRFCAIYEQNTNGVVGQGKA